jgi:hypothetical protein
VNNKFKLLNIIQLGLWIISIIGLLTIILIPKNEALLNFLFFVFIILFVIMPIILVVFNLIAYRIYEPKINNAYIIMPFVGLSFMTLLSLIYFLTSINKSGKIQMLLIIIVVLLFNLYSIWYLIKQKDYLFIRHAILLGIGLLIFLLTFFGSVYISYYNSINY